MKRTLMVLCLATAASALFAQTQATLRDIKGKVEVKQLGKNWVPAKNGMVVDTLSTISTGFDSQATLAIADNRIAVAPLTRLTVDKIIEQAGTAGTSLHLRVGKVSAEVKSSKGIPQDFKVTSPYSTASVRGTEFSYDGFVLEVAEGNVAFIPGKPKRDIVVPAAVLKKSAAAPEGEAKAAEGEQAGEQAAAPAEGEGTGEQAAAPAEGEGTGEQAAAPAEGEGTGEQAAAPAEGETAAPAEGLAQGIPASDQGYDLTEFMAVVQAENPNDSFETSDESGAAVAQAPAPGTPAPTSPAPGAPASTAPAPAAPPAPAPAPIVVAAGSVAVVSVDFAAPAAAAPGGKSAPATQVATGVAGTVSTAAGGALNAGQTKIETPAYVAPASTPTTGKIKLRWKEAQ